MTHSIINVLSQITIDTDRSETFLLKIFVILVSCYMVVHKKMSIIGINKIKYKPSKPNQKRFGFLRIRNLIFSI